MSGYHPRHAANVASEEFPSSEPPHHPSRGSLGLAAGALAVLAVVAVLIVASLPHASHPVSVRRPRNPTTVAVTHKVPTSTSSSATRVVKKAPTGATTTAASKHATSTSTTRPLASAPRATSTPSSSQPSSSQPSSNRPSSGPAANPATTVTTSAATTSATAVNLPVPAGFGPLLRQIWVSANPDGAGVTEQDVQSTLPGSVYYAEQPAIGNYWAISSFVPTAQAQVLESSQAGKTLLAQFGYFSVFNRAPGRGWAYLGSFQPGSCPTVVPAPVYAAWGLCQVGS